MKIDLKKGDTILGGKFKNKKYVVDDFEEDENNQPIIKTKSKKKLKALSFRIDKLMPKNIEKKNENKELSLVKMLNETTIKSPEADKMLKEFESASIKLRKILVEITGGYDNGSYKDRRIAEIKKHIESVYDLVDEIINKR